MDEQAYRDTYRAVNPERCVFEKSILTRQLNCSLAERFCLAEREGVSCKNQAAQARCVNALGLLKHNSQFALHEAHHVGELPHAKMIRVQVGGLRGIQAAIDGLNESALPVIDDIHGTLEAAANKYGDLADLPFDHVMPFIASYQGRPRRRPRR